jgi:hypothetical protein
MALRPGDRIEVDALDAAPRCRVLVRIVRRRYHCAIRYDDVETQLEVELLEVGV